MKCFETRFGAGKGQEVVFVHPHQEALWAKAFGVETLDGMWDLETAAKAIPILDAAILMFNHSPEQLRPLLSADDMSGLRGNRLVLEQMRATLADHDDATISGAVEHL